METKIFIENTKVNINDKSIYGIKRTGILLLVYSILFIILGLLLKGGINLVYSLIKMIL